MDHVLIFKSYLRNFLLILAELDKALKADDSKKAREILAELIKSTNKGLEDS